MTDIERLRRLAADGDWWAQHELRREERRREPRTTRDLAALIRRAEDSSPSIDGRIEAAREAVRLADGLGIAMVRGRFKRSRGGHTLHLRGRSYGLGCRQARGGSWLCDATEAVQQMVGGLVCRACLRSMESAR